MPGTTRAPWCSGSPAPPERAEKQSLADVFEDIVYQKSSLEMMQAGFLCDLRAIQVLLRAHFDALHTRHGDFIESELADVLMRANAPAQV